MDARQNRPCLLITRPIDGARRFAQDAEAAGFAVLLDPMLRLTPRPAPDPSVWNDTQAILLTSPTAAPLAGKLAPAEIKVLAVGDATAIAARAAGFQSVASAAGDARALAKMAINDLSPGGGRVIHAAGAQRAGDLAGALGAAGFDALTVVLYDQIPAERLGAETLEALRDRAIDYASFFSPQTGARFARLVQDSGMAENLSCVHAFALSEAVSGAISDVSWQSVAIAEKPTSNALLACLIASAFGANNGAYRANER